MLSLVGSDTDDIPIRWKSKSKCNGKSTIMFVSEEYLKLIDELYRLKRVEAISLVSVSIKDTIIIKLNNALSTLIVVDVDCEYIVLVNHNVSHTVTNYLDCNGFNYYIKGEYNNSLFLWWKNEKERRFKILL